MGEARRNEDHDALEEAIDCYERVCELWRGEVLTDLRYFDDVAAERAHVEQTLVGALCRGGELLLAANRPERARAIGTRVIEHDPLIERAHRVVITAFVQERDEAGARNALRTCRSVIEASGLSLEAETEMLARRIENPSAVA